MKIKADNPDTGNKKDKTKKADNPDTGNKKLFKVVSGALIEGHATYHIGNTIMLTEERALQIGKQIEPVIEKTK